MCEEKKKRRDENITKGSNNKGGLCKQCNLQFTNTASMQYVMISVQMFN